MHLVFGHTHAGPPMQTKQMPVPKGSAVVSTAEHRALVCTELEDGAARVFWASIGYFLDDPDILVLFSLFRAERGQESPKISRAPDGVCEA